MEKKSRKSIDSHSMQEGLKLMRNCPICKQEFSEGDIKIVEKQGDSSLVHVTCAKCLNAVLAVILISPFGMSSVGVITDLDEQDVMRMNNKASISEEDVLNFYQFVESVDSAKVLTRFY